MSEGTMQRDPETLVEHIAGTPSSWRGEVAPTIEHSFRRSVRHGIKVPRCPECDGRRIADGRGGPVMRHTKGCSIPGTVLDRVELPHTRLLRSSR